ncbi:Crinkler (CRN) family protein [Planoprotostelium fungivorum]|uniref:Crinkler (CRN) family protein n=1 Tax=Planoprotostelium fungivorum TaxID=1890364 RepID=A0A2P6N3F5_9EUKA|nr:Crinkler (CRN) family protein [Planoprotostelium fungivorum]
MPYTANHPNRAALLSLVQQHRQNGYNSAFRGKASTRILSDTTVEDDEIDSWYADARAANAQPPPNNVDELWIDLRDAIILPAPAPSAGFSSHSGDLEGSIWLCVDDSVQRKATWITPINSIIPIHHGNDLESLPTISSLQGLIGYLQSSPAPIPLNLQDWDDVTDLLQDNNVRNRFFIHASPSGVHSHQAFNDLWRMSITARPCSGTEDSWHARWDGPISTVCMYFGYTWNRNTCNSTSTGRNRDSSRPDYVIYYRDQALARGEEKPSSNFSSCNPQDELVEKLNWNYHGLPYLYGWSAVGDNIHVYAITHSKGKNHRHSLFNLDIAHAADRLKLANIVRNMLRSLQALVDTISNPKETLLLTLERPDFREVIIDTINNRVVKKWKEHSSFDEQKAKELSQKSIPFTDQRYRQRTALVQWEWVQKTAGNYLCTMTAPIGEPISLPLSDAELKKALICILTALSELHKYKVVHRDIRWPNVIYHQSTQSYLLIDFEDAFYCPPSKVSTKSKKLKKPKETSPMMPLRPLGQSGGSHAPEVNTMPCQPGVDIWAVGRLIALNGTPVPFQHICIHASNIDITQRPTAQDLLTQLQEIQIS